MFYIYKIVGINYIGSTNNIKQRCRNHKTNCWNENSKNHNIFVYKYIREKNIKIELKILGVYKRKCSKKIKLLVEQFYINEYDSVNNGLNTFNSFTNKKKYLKEWREENKEYDKKYQEENKEKIKKYQKEWREKNKEKNKDKLRIKINCPICNSLVRKTNLTTHQRTKKCKSFQSNFK